MKTYKDSLLRVVLSVIPTEFKKSKYFFVLKSITIDSGIAIADCEKSY